MCLKEWLDPNRGGKTLWLPYVPRLGQKIDDIQIVNNILQLFGVYSFGGTESPQATCIHGNNILQKTQVY